MSGGSITVTGNKLSYVSQDATHVPPVLAKLHGGQVTSVDLSYNRLRTVNDLEGFLHLEELVLDNNELSDDLVLPKIPKLHTLSLNNNNIHFLDNLLMDVKKCYPNLRYLSLLGNPACPSPISHKDKDEDDYQKYRYYVIYCLPSLDFLDYSPVRQPERKEAEVRGYYMKIARPTFKANDSIESQSYPKYTPLPNSPTRRPQGVYGKVSYIYTGKHSEGNRFIKNKDL